VHGTHSSGQPEQLYSVIKESSKKMMIAVMFGVRLAGRVARTEKMKHT
jgi:hypothetical protein